MNLERYSRQTQLKEFGLEAQEKLSVAKILVIGAGGLGVPALTYLNAMGVGTLGIVDNDVVSLSNLHRQVSYYESEVGEPKVSSLIKKLKAQNSDTKLVAHHTFLTTENALELIAQYDLVLDASDNFPTRYLVNDACVILKRPFVYGALHSFEGQVSVFNYENGPTYRCIFPTMPNPAEIPNCDENGVLGVVPGIIGSLQALEAVKVITGIGEVLSGKFLLFDGLSQNYQKINFKKVAGNITITALKDSYEFNCAVPQASVSAQQFAELLQSEKIQLLDVRTTEEYHHYHIADSIHIPLSDLESNLEKIDYSKTIYVICQSGIRSQKAIHLITAIKPEVRLVNIEGGINKLKSYALR
ncbi:HesA/MoeB/ThiF family protein [Cellulophaga sp. E16_2]|uniref:HesA/MoeB/ThiF family protein n=1 Tax=Cellulophaga sp. E16_2 TaxID=2789297 RepID=UPI001A918A8E|nr:HesA/MoeB/ThiF family protein [Cellulophaga sp. E16_2]MBO0592401.1 HesA/MoeB/ThiF family protein [Cellulophaga sp. E16_2]